MRWTGRAKRWPGSRRHDLLHDESRRAGAGRLTGRAGPTREVYTMTYYTTKAAAQALADSLAMQDADAWRYEVQAGPRGFYVAVFDFDNFFLGNL